MRKIQYIPLEQAGGQVLGQASNTVDIVNQGSARAFISASASNTVNFANASSGTVFVRGTGSNAVNINNASTAVTGNNITGTASNTVQVITTAQAQNIVRATASSVVLINNVNQGQPRVAGQASNTVQITTVSAQENYLPLVLINGELAEIPKGAKLPSSILPVMSGGSGNQEIYIGSAPVGITFPALVFETTTIGGETVYTMKVNVP